MDPPDPKWIDLKDVRLWINTCDSEHGEECHPSSPNMERPIWLIDVVQGCIVPAGQHRYITLSYVWGGVESAQTTLDNLEQMQLPGTLDEGDGGEGEERHRLIIPKTVRHAMGLVKRLGEMHLWVDRFCICQDDAKTKHAQLQSMAGIYANAYLTIVAADEWDANHGLRGIKGVTRPRDLSPYLTTSEYVDLTDIYSSIWTFQEDMFSRRKLLFQYQLVRWECRCDEWHESTGVSGRTPGRGPPPARQRRNPKVNAMISKGLPENKALMEYFNVVSAYNIRNLTYPEDGLQAYLGILSQLSDIFPEGFFWGLPISSFHAALLWQPRERLKRRHPRAATTDAQTIPSWSWVGWQGGISGFEFHLPPFGRTLEPMCVWKTMNQGQVIRPRSTGDELTAAEAYTSPHHENPLLYTYAPVARAWLEKRDKGSTLDSWAETNYYAKIFEEYLDRTGCDLIRICPSSDQSDYTTCGAMVLSPGLRDHSEIRKECEFLAISTCKARKKLFKASPSFEFCYYNVIWIKRKDGVVYRKGLGLILVDAWDALNPKYEEIVLG
ncbi:hypothetical protein PG993_005970 [Apiospora rasikravindrae]|uniref:Heterokaryon incompatibility domain-containing protein n=1 Tax=Apiospora rasikravindrae TaxID=990691 RepID=A0ABR1TAA7_9PEZI